MGWLARMSIERASAKHRHLSVLNAYTWHQAAWQAFPNLDQQARPFLSRLDLSLEGFNLLLLSRAHRPERPDWCPEQCWALKPIPDYFLLRKYYRFDLHANPSRKVIKLGTDGERTKNGRRRPLTKLAERIEWLSRKAEQSGFAIIEEPEIAFREDQTFQKKTGHGVHTAVRFRGILEVTDTTRFEDAFYAGVGSAKGFGFGMLVLQPIRS